MALLFGVVLGLLALPFWRFVLVNFNQTEYGRLTYLCDSAMRTHYIAKARTAASPSEKQVEALERAELALIDCQDYDILQKKLMLWGLRENELGLMRLRSIEADAEGLKDVVDAHEIRD
ncbi:MAG: hypothetical protein COA43_07975 [Robiginitomaculum sp.]|nr:MAG: hypothetical protein COA43_07975 [Robiginitomaculum sp.]